MEDRIKTLKNTAKDIRKLTIESIGHLGVGHIGGSMSIVEIITALYFDVMTLNVQDPSDETRDRLVLSKGHGGPTLYSALAMKGYISKDDLKTLNQPNTHLPSHCDRRLTRGIDMTTGSLGQGFSAAVGMALAMQIDGASPYVYTIIGDGESQEGQIWEAALFAGARQLDQLIAFTDYNKMQIDGYVQDVIGLDPLPSKWESFGWHVQSIDGHDIQAILEAIEEAKSQQGRPSMIILNTVKGKGCSFCESKVSSHNMPVTQAQMADALKALESEVVG